MQKNKGKRANPFPPLIVFLIFISCQLFLVNKSADAYNFFYERDRLFYTFVLNIAPDDFHIPLLGLVNIGGDTSFGIHIGLLTNVEQKEFSGLQLGTANITLDDSGGSQLGVFNFTQDGFHGSQSGVVNIAGREMTGVQAGLVNIAGELQGIQIGLVNIVDTIGYGMPLGLINIVKYGGFRGADLFYSAIAPFNVNFRIGIDWYYSLLALAIDPLEHEMAFAGIGVGLFLHIGGSFFFTPELTAYLGISTDFPEVDPTRIDTLYDDWSERMRYLAVLAPIFSFQITDFLDLFAGPEFSYIGRLSATKPRKFFGMGIHDDNRIGFGARAGIKITW